MSDDGIKQLRRALGNAPPKALHALSDSELRRLAETIESANQRQEQALADAGEAAIGHLPWLLRGPVRRVLR